MSSAPRRFLIVRLSSIGDTILTTPVLAAIKDAVPDSVIDWVVGAKSRQIIEMCPEADQVFTFPKLLGARGLLLPSERRRQLADSLRTLHREMSERRYDVAIDVQGLFKSGLATFVSGAKLRLGWWPGASREMSWLFTNRWLRMRYDCHVVDCWRHLVQALGMPLGPVRFPIVPPQDSREEMAAYLASVRASGPVVVMNVGSSLPEKCWSPDRFADVAVRAHEAFGARSLFTWGNDADRAAADEAVRLAGPRAAVTAPKTSLFTLAALAEACDAFVGPDTGPTHLAAALGTPVIGLYGVTDPMRLGPWGQPERIVSAYPQDGSSEDLTMEGVRAEDVYLKLAAVLTQVSGRPAE